MQQRVKEAMGASVALDCDAELMLRVKDGDGASFVLLLGKYRASVNHFLYRIATHLALNGLRDQKNGRALQRLDESSEDAPARDVQDRAPTVEQKLLHQVSVDEIRQAVAALPDKQRAAVLMHKYDEMEYSQIAKVLSCSESAVKSLLFRAYETLRVRLAHMA